MTEINLTLPWPANPLWPNKRPCMHAKRKSVKRARQDAWLVASAALVKSHQQPPEWPRAVLQWTFYGKSKGPLPDPDNCIAAIKAYIDGLVDAGLFSDDRHLTHLPPVVLRDGDCRVELTITGEPNE